MGADPNVWWNAEVVGNIVGAGLAFVLGALATVFTQLWLERRRRAQVRFSRTTEQPLTVAKEELKEKLKILYGSREIEDLYWFLAFLSCSLPSSPLSPSFLHLPIE